MSVRFRACWAATATMLALAACGGPASSASSGEPTSSSVARSPVIANQPSSSPASLAPGSGSPSQTGSAFLDIGSLPDASLDPDTVTAICDPEPGAANVDAGESTISCEDGLVLGSRAMKTVVTVPVERLYLRRAVCQSIPCTDDALDTAIVTGWAAGAPFSVGLDSRLTTVTVPAPDTPATWPSFGSPAAAPVRRPIVDGAPLEVSERTPYPFCGIRDFGSSEGASAVTCFRDAVLAGRMAEFIDHVFGTEGGAITWVYRFSGLGAVIRYASDPSGSWLRQAGSMILHASSPDWDFDPWPETSMQLP